MFERNSKRGKKMLVIICSYSEQEGFFGDLNP
jgi:hypothetical protein